MALLRSSAMGATKRYYCSILFRTCNRTSRCSKAALLLQPVIEDTVLDYCWIISNMFLLREMIMPKLLKLYLFYWNTRFDLVWLAIKLELLFFRKCITHDTYKFENNHIQCLLTHISQSRSGQDVGKFNIIITINF